MGEVDGKDLRKKICFEFRVEMSIGVIDGDSVLDGRGDLR